MTTQAKNRILAILVTLGLAVILLSGCIHGTTKESGYSEVLIPTGTPSTLIVSDADDSAQREFECLRLNIYHEAGNQSRRGMEAVALVTVNRTRTKHFPDTVCDVVHQGVVRNGEFVRNMCHFSWNCDGKDDRPNLHIVTKDKDGNTRLVPNERELEAWEAAGEVAEAVLAGEVKDFLNRSTHYHATYVNPRWSRAARMARQVQVGTHVFYRDVKLGLKV